jgi:hypothetical protein
MSRGLRKTLRVLDRRSFGAGLAVSALSLTTVSVGAYAKVWEWPPDQLLNSWINLTFALVILWVLNGRIGPVVEAYRLGMAAGRRQQRDECEHTCGHACSDDTREIVARAVGQAEVPASVGGAHLRGRRGLHVVKQ